MVDDIGMTHFDKVIRRLRMDLLSDQAIDTTFAQIALILTSTDIVGDHIIAGEEVN